MISGEIMGDTHRVAHGETLWSIAVRYYGDGLLGERLAEYNGIRDPHSIRVGQTLIIPAKEQLSPHGVYSIGEIFVPNGLAGIIREFGDIFRYIGEDGSLDPQWEKDILCHVTFPAPIALAWDQSKTVTGFRCHKKLREIFAGVFAEIHRRGLWSKLESFGGCYNFRPQRRGSKLSTHCWGIAVDLNPLSNPQGTKGKMDMEIVSIFTERGFFWGGRWLGKSRDPMHFQFALGY
ncbi:MAG: M15 family metallopeptidase [bacterium JZ-2024 1]